jgi:delta(3,5)-delta(2,4)-dienoyl-CoA isomerase
VICILHGHCLGLAIDLSLCADIRLCTRSTIFSVKEVDIGIAADIGTLTRLPKAVGNASWVKEVCLTAREWGADEAVSAGFVSRVLGDKEEAVREGERLCRLMAEKSPVAVLGTKELLNYGRGRTVEEGLGYTAVWNAAMLQTADVAVAVGKGGRGFEKL